LPIKPQAPTRYIVKTYPPVPVKYKINTKGGLIMAGVSRQRRTKTRTDRPNLFNISPRFIGENLRKILDENKISQADLAYHAQLSTNTINSYYWCGSVEGEKPKGIGLNGLVQITHALNHLNVKVNLHDLLGLPDIKNTDTKTAQDIRIEIYENIENLVIRRNGEVVFNNVQESHKNGGIVGFILDNMQETSTNKNANSISITSRVANLYSLGDNVEERIVEDAYAIIKGNLYKCLPGGEFANYDSAHVSIYDYLNQGGALDILKRNYSKNRAYMGTLGEMFNANEFVLLCYMLGYLKEGFDD
jgi:hypothetical protein